ncbi:MAG TPA: Imm26 family immunity protein [Telluria sp.]|jgi:hypothetical protein
MGWWNAPDNPEVTVGDAVLDTVRHFLRDFSREYQEDLSRKPTLQELEYALNLAFKVNVDSDILDGFDELEIKQVTLKTAKRPKKQKVSPGDIFAYRLDDGRYGFGRIISDASIGAFAEIFDHFAEQPVSDFSKLDKWLVPPVPIDSYALLETRSKGDWRIVGHTSDFVPGPEYKSLRYVYGIPPNGQTVTDVFGHKEPISGAEAEGLPRYSAYDDFRFKELIASHVPPRTNPV